MRFHCVLCLVILSISIVNRSATALDFDYVKIADSATLVPVEGSVFGLFQPPALDGYQVAFRGNRSSGGGGLGKDALFVSSGGVLTRIAGDTTPIPAGVGNFNAFGNPALSFGNIAFRGVDGPGTASGVYTNINGLNSVADESTPNPIPSGTGTFTDVGNPSLHGNYVAFSALGAGQSGVYSNVGGLNAIANLSTPIPSGSGNFTDFGITPAIRDAIVAFQGFGAGQAGIYTNSAGLVRVADFNTAIPDGGGVNFNNFGTPTISLGNVAFRGAGAGQSGIYTDVGGLNSVANLATPIPGGTGNFTSFNENVTLDNGNVVFQGMGSSQSGIYTNYGGTLTTVVNIATFIDGKRVVGFPSGLSRRSFAEGNVAFFATFSDGSMGIYVAQQTHAYAANASGAWDTPSNWSFGASPKTIVPTVIRPINGAVVTGPASATTVRGLDLYSAVNGVAELRLQTTGQLNVLEFLSVYERGLLNINGGVATANFATFNYGEIDLGNGGQLGGGALYNNGTLRGSGTVGTGIYNSGRIQAIGSQLRVTSLVENTATDSRIDARDALLQFDGGLYNTAQVNFSFGTSDIFGDIENADNGRIIASGNSNVTFYDDIVHYGSEIRVSAGSTAVFFGDVSGPGAFTATGTVHFEGSYNPGASPATVSLENDVTFGENATLGIELGGAAVGQYDQVHVSGDLSLDGKLDVSLINGFQPAAGQLFDILNWGSLSGEFADIELPDLSGSRQWNTSRLYSEGVLLVISGLAGDYNNDGTVNAADYTVYRNRKAGIGGTTLPNDAGAPGVTIDDYNYWKAHYGEPNGSGSSLSDNTANAPEPATIWLACLGLLGAGGCRRRIADKRPQGGGIFL